MDMTLVRYRLMANPTIQHAVHYVSDVIKWILYIVRKLANLGSWPLIFCSWLFCTKYQKNYIVGKLEIKPIE
jgi:hypothetical protein